MKFATLLRYIRQKQGLTTAEISSRISVVSTTYYAWERDKFKPNVASLRKLEKALALPAGCLQFFYDGKDLKRVYISHPLRNGKTGDELIGEVEKNRERSLKYAVISCMNATISLSSPLSILSVLSPSSESKRRHSSNVNLFSNLQTNSGYTEIGAALRDVK